MSSSLHYVLANAFAAEPNCGNPAGELFLPQTCLPSNGTPYTTEKMQALARNLNQPVSAFLSPLPEDEEKESEADYAIRYFTPTNEVRNCGHATVATTKAILAFPELAAIANKSNRSTDVPEEFQLQTASGPILKSKIISVSPDGDSNFIEHIQLSFPHCPTIPIPADCAAGHKILAALSIALRKPEEDIDLIYMGYGTGTFSFYVLIELGIGEGLDGKEIAIDAFVRAVYPF